MIKKSSKTYLGLDLSINGTGVALISTNSELLHGGPSIPINGTQFSFIRGTYARGSLKKGKTEYAIFHLQDGEMALDCREFSSDEFSRAETVFELAVRPMLELSPDKIIIESYNYNGNGKIFEIAEFTGIMKYLISRFYFEKNKPPPIYLVPPLSLKKFITGNGGVYSKEVIMEAIENKYHLSIKQPDIADALGLALMGINSIGF